MLPLLIALVLMVAPAARAAEAEVCHTLSRPQVEALFDRWNAALATGDPTQVTALYSDDALLLPTLSGVARTDAEGISNYFQGFLSHDPTGRIDQRVIHSDCNMAIDAGNYSFELDHKGWVQARYTFVYAYKDGEWKIEHHHSSLLPTS
ncbi:MAG: SgcJ/EcaC family oxidoreductase [Vulcanococcus sp.]